MFYGNDARVEGLDVTLDDPAGLRGWVLMDSRIYSRVNSSALQAMAAYDAHGRVVVNDAQSVINNTTNLSEELPVINDTIDLSGELSTQSMP